MMKSMKAQKWVDERSLEPNITVRDVCAMHVIHTMHVQAVQETNRLTRTNQYMASSKHNVV